MLAGRTKSIIISRLQIIEFAGCVLVISGDTGYAVVSVRIPARHNTKLFFQREMPCLGNFDLGMILHINVLGI